MTRFCPICAFVLLLPLLALGGDFEQGLEAFKKHDDDQAFTCFDAAIREHPTTVASYFYRGASGFRCVSDHVRGKLLASLVKEGMNAKEVEAILGDWEAMFSSNFSVTDCYFRLGVTVQYKREDIGADIVYHVDSEPFTIPELAELLWPFPLGHGYPQETSP